MRKKKTKKAKKQEMREKRGKWKRLWLWSTTTKRTRALAKVAGLWGRKGQGASQG
jgi:hypothetical protein